MTDDRYDDLDRYHPAIRTIIDHERAQHARRRRRPVSNEPHAGGPHPAVTTIIEHERSQRLGKTHR